MYKKVIYKSVLILTLVLSCSCNKYLTLYPQDGVTRQEFWQSKEQVQAAVMGVYASLLADPAAKDRTLAEYLFMWGELRADNVIPTGVSADEENVSAANILPTNSVVKWADVYRTINLCNTVLDFAPAVLQHDNTLTQDKLNGYLAEMLTIRSLMYFYLARSFRDVPLKLKSTASDADLQQLAVTKQADILKQIVADLAAAEKNAVYTYGDKASDKGRITKYSVYALEADVNLWMENYQGCIDNCDKIINSGQFGLVNGDGGFFNTLYYVGNSNESIFEFQYDNQVLNSFYPMFLTNKLRFLASPNLTDIVYTQDPVNSDNYDIRLPYVAVNPRNSEIWKYVGATNGNVSRTSDVSYAHWIVYRYADILLMKAEACAWVKPMRGADALNLIQQVRTRAHALNAQPSIGFSGSQETPDVNDPLEVSNYVLAERDREFSFEGKRWYDVLRNAKRNNYANISILMDVVSLNAPGSSLQSVLAKYRDANFHYFPIYYNEIALDPNLVQNPFYK